jgi:hypothetical protein
MHSKINEVINIDTSSDYEYLYEGLSRQNIDFHQSIAELIDNAISARAESYFTIEILLYRDGDIVTVTVADDGKGITKHDLQNRVLKLGGRGTSLGVLNEHGFGLKNSLCLLTQNKSSFSIITKSDEISNRDTQWVIRGPFRSDMNARLINDNRWSKNLTLCKGKTGTRIIAQTTLDYFRTTYKRAIRMDILASKLGEHLGVFYRHWLLSDPRNQIWIRWKEKGADWQDLVVPAIKLPLSDDHQSWSIDVEVNGIKGHATYISGELQEEKTQGDRTPYPLDIYYKHNERSQGVDVVVHNKVILVHQLEDLWPDMIRRRERNYFLGELILEGDVFATVNNKTGLDPHNPFWIKVKEQLMSRAELEPPSYSTGREEAAISQDLVEALEHIVSGSSAQRNFAVWAGAGVRADIVHKGPSVEWIDVYEVKDEQAGPQDVYQLIMYWDGLVNDGLTPRLGRLVAESAPDSVINLIAHWNKRNDIKNNPYKIEFKKISDLGIRVVRTGLSKRPKRIIKKRENR